MDEIDVKLKNVISDVFGIPVDRISGESSKKNTENWDSVQHLNLVLEIEAAFDISFTPEEVLELQNYSEIKKSVSRHLSEN